MVLLYQLDCNKVLHMMDQTHNSLEHETNTVSETEQFSDYWDNNLRSELNFILQLFLCRTDAIDVDILP